MPTPMRWQVLACLAILGLGSRSPAQDQPAPAAATNLKQAEADYLRARLARVEAELARDSYVSTVLPEKVAALEAEITLARLQRDQALWRLAWVERMAEHGFALPNEVIVARLKLSMARFVLERAETNGLVLTRYTQQKTIKGLQNEVEKLAAVEATKETAFQQAGTRRVD